MRFAFNVVRTYHALAALGNNDTLWDCRQKRFSHTIQITWNTLKRVKWLKAFFRTWGQFTLFSWILIGCWTLFWLALLMIARTRVLARLLPRTCYFRGIPGSFCNSLLLCLVTFIALFGQVLWRVTRKFSNSPCHHYCRVCWKIKRGATWTEGTTLYIKRTVWWLKGKDEVLYQGNF